MTEIFDKMKNSIENHKIISLKEAVEKFSLNFVPKVILESYKQDDLVYLVEEDAHFENFEIDKLFESDECIGIVFCKNLSASNNIIQEAMDYGPLVIVFGDVNAQNIYVSGGDVFFRGAVTAEKTLVCGVYNHGETHIKGEISAEVIISLDHSFNYEEENLKKGILVNNNLIYRSENLNEILDLLNEDLYDEEDEYFDTSLVLKLIKENHSVLRK
jgi:hypothetical protein